MTNDELQQLKSAIKVRPNDTWGSSVILKLIAKVESLAADAGRYKHLRKSALMGYPSSEGSNLKDAYLVITGYGWEDSEAIVDQAVDATMAKEKA